MEFNVAVAANHVASQTWFMISLPEPLCPAAGRGRRGSSPCLECPGSPNLPARLSRSVSGQTLDKAVLHWLAGAMYCPDLGLRWHHLRMANRRNPGTGRPQVGGAARCDPSWRQQYSVDAGHSRFRRGEDRKTRNSGMPVFAYQRGYVRGHARATIEGWPFLHVKGVLVEFGVV